MNISFLFVLPFFAIVARVAGLAIIAPVFGSSSIPKTVRLMIVLCLGFSAWSMTAGIPVQSIGPLDVLVLLAGEFAIGATIGFLMSLPLVAMQMGGSLIGQQMSIALPAMLDPATGSESDEMGKAFIMFAIVGFVIIGGVEQTYIATANSFHHLPFITLIEGSFGDMLAGFLDTVFEFGLRVALPLIAVILIQTVAIAMVARSMPQLNIFSVGLPVRILVALMLLVFGMSFISGLMANWIPNMVDSVSNWASGGHL
tara:strand:- start:299 stop:1066 length:768 start_codon:yes stop_codon:yes gene_type:complete